MGEAENPDFEVAVVGAGAAGLAAALALSRDGLRTALLGRHAPVADGRTVALLDGSVRFLGALGAWEAIAPSAAALAELHLIDDTGSLFRPPPARFVAAEIGLGAFGWNVESARLVEALRACARAAPGLTLIEEDVAGAAPAGGAATVTLEGGAQVRARLVVAADGARSPLREAAGIPVRRWDYPQAALTTILSHARDHREISTEFHTRQGPFTLVPLPGGRRSSLVWVTAAEKAERLRGLDDAALAAAVERRAQALLGRMAIDGPRGVVPMRGLLATRPVAPRLALVGEAAHVFPPIGAQGLNLGLRDAAALRDLLVEARQGGADPGGEALLGRFARGRALDARLRSGAVDALNRSLLSGLLPADLLRGAGLLALSTIAPLRRAVMREGILPRFGTPRLMRA
ncbi:Ubiquinone biosynthesis hydroxylase, UbiH/UbiF/VisC/COQ6 family [Methylobacterium sp. 4-46]|uniref:UbiH/UbiF family hydroxylase n=1 Tax=unclassified Methylobacterium TaxID=2615210 RepID=UPI000152BDEF|nr:MULTISPECIES: UbiH/UbiF family hydroxylase [Methylobacterium]ACA17635.1 Ubiquinone biosynthesis hydroxylase, UbiH/UbiF/VisC/COQ6 family [Methylobacterium sp. 4-46]WFT83306.1 UbiH/UbiF family hydroxylase [Methylobacterium nodulans]